LSRWLPATYRWLEWGTERAPSLFRRPTFPELYEVSEKILILRIAGREVRACLDTRRVVCNHTAILCVPWSALSGVCNRSIKKSARYRNEKPQRLDLPKREELEEVSQRFSAKFLLAIMNSKTANNLLQKVRRSNTDLYPEDWKKLPIPDVSLEHQEPIIKLVDQILASKEANLSADISSLEAEISDRVAHLYGLTPGNQIIEGGLK
jgi:adenine-specific DNA-methyltransferase